MASELPRCKPITLDPPSPNNMVPSVFHLNSKIAQKLSYGTDTLSPVSRGGSEGLDKGENVRQRDPSQTQIQYPPSAADHYCSSDQQGGQSDGRVSQKQLCQNTTASEPPPMPVGHQPLDFDKPQKSQAHSRAYRHTGGAGTSRTNLPNTIGGRKTSRREVGSNSSHELLIHWPVFVITDTNIGLDLTLDVEDNDEGKYWSGERRDNHGASYVTFLVLSHPAPNMGGGLVLNLNDSTTKVVRVRTPPVCPSVPLDFGG